MTQNGVVVLGGVDGVGPGGGDGTGKMPGTSEHGPNVVDALEQSMSIQPMGESGGGQDEFAG